MRAPIAILPAFTAAAVALAPSPLLACGASSAAQDRRRPRRPPRSRRPRTACPTRPPIRPTASAVRISDEIVKACGINEPDAYFAFDSANVRAETTRRSCSRSSPASRPGPSRDARSSSSATPTRAATATTT